VTARAAMLLLLALAGDLAAAPVPPPRPRPPLAGEWTALWSGSPFLTVLRHDGGYRAERAGGWTCYEGRWSLEGDRLTIEERVTSAEGHGPTYRYTFTLRAGRTDSACGGLRLLRRR
jgi:hypothetical protein